MGQVCVTSDKPQVSFDTNKQNIQINEEQLQQSDNIQTCDAYATTINTNNKDDTKQQSKQSKITENGDNIHNSAKTPLLQSYDAVPSRELFIARRGGWLEARYHFRFAQWRPDPDKHPKKYRFGSLYVMNDDIIECDSGFGEHPHSNVDIFTYVINGELTHKDSNDNNETLQRGCVQYMSVGDTIWHSEMNRNDFEKCRLIQTWIKPFKSYKNDKNKNNDTQYGSLKFSKQDRHNKLLQIIESPLNKNENEMIRLRQDVNVFVCELDEMRNVQFELDTKRQAYLVCIEGKLRVSGLLESGIDNNSNNKDEIELMARDSMRLYGKIGIKLTGIGKEGDLDSEIELPMPSAHFMIIEMKQTDKPDEKQKEFRPNDPYWTDSSNEED